MCSCLCQLHRSLRLHHLGSCCPTFPRQHNEGASRHTAHLQRIHRRSARSRPGQLVLGFCLHTMSCCCLRAAASPLFQNAPLGGWLGIGVSALGPGAASSCVGVQPLCRWLYLRGRISLCEDRSEQQDKPPSGLRRRRLERAFAVAEEHWPLQATRHAHLQSSAWRLCKQGPRAPSDRSVRHTLRSCTRDVKGCGCSRSTLFSIGSLWPQHSKVGRQAQQK